MYQLTRINLELTSRCNFSCSFCARTLLRNNSIGDLSKEIFDIFIAQVCEIKTLKQINLMFQGEPTLHEHLYDIICRIKQKCNIKVIMYTNGSKLSKELSQQLLDSKLDELIISVEGISAEENKQFRPELDFQYLLEQIEIFKSLKKPSDHTLLSVSKVVKNSNSSDLAKYIRFWRKKVDYIRVNKYCDYMNEQNKIMQCNNCVYPKSRMVITWDGDVLPCCYDVSRSMVMGNIKNGTILEIWNSLRYNEFRMNVQQGNEELCKTCDWV